MKKNANYILYLGDDDLILIDDITLYKPLFTETESVHTSYADSININSGNNMTVRCMNFSEMCQMKECVKF